MRGEEHLVASQDLSVSLHDEETPVQGKERSCPRPEAVTQWIKELGAYIWTRENEPFLRLCGSSLLDYSNGAVAGKMAEIARATYKRLRRLLNKGPNPAGELTNEHIDSSIDTLWEEITSRDDEILKEFISMENEAYIFYIVGVKEGTRLLLTNGGLWTLLYASDSLRTPRLIDSIEDLMKNPMSQLRVLSLKYGTNVDGKPLIAEPLFRPKHREQLEFLTGAETTRTLMLQFKVEYQAFLVNILNSYSSNRGSPLAAYFENVLKRTRPETSGIENSFYNLLIANIQVIGEPFHMFLSLADSDKLEVALGSLDLADDILEKRANVIIKALRLALGKTSTSPFVVATNNFKEFRAKGQLAAYCASEIVPRIREFVDILKPEFMYHLAFFIGPIHAAVLSKDGTATEIVYYEKDRDGSAKKYFDENNKQRKIERSRTTTFEALRPSQAHINTLFQNTLDDELDRIRPLE